jgi:hypothetical protein
MWTELNLTTVANLTTGGALFLIGLLIGSYVRPYLAKKGENLATHEDISKLIDQVKAVTEATKKIETEMSIGVWDKQKRWDMKREVLFEAARRLSEVEDAMLSYGSAMKLDRAKQRDWATAPPSIAEKVPVQQAVAESATKWSKASAALDETRLFVGIVCGKDTREAFEDLRKFVSTLAVQIAKVPDAYQTSRPDLLKKVAAARDSIRKELEVDA